MRTDRPPSSSDRFRSGQDVSEELPLDLVEAVRTALETALAIVGLEPTEPVLRHLADCGALLATSLRRDCAELELTPLRRGEQHAYLLGVAMGFVQLEPKAPADLQPAQDCESAVEAFRRRRRALESLLAVRAPGGDPIVEEPLARRMSACAFALRCNLDADADHVNLPNPVLELAQLYERMLVGDRRPGRTSVGRERIRKLRLLTPIRAWGHARHGVLRAHA